MRRTTAGRDQFPGNSVQQGPGRRKLKMSHSGVAKEMNQSAIGYCDHFNRWLILCSNHLLLIEKKKTKTKILQGKNSFRMGCFGER